MKDERYKELMAQVGLPNSRSLLQALQQCAMEAALEERSKLMAEVERLRAENERLEMLLQTAYCQKIGSDAPHGLGCCDNYRDWLSSLSPNT